MLSFETFVISDASRDAFEAAVAVAEDRAGEVLFLHGPTGSGKSHLLQAIAHRMQGRRVMHVRAEELIASLLAAIRFDKVEAFSHSLETIDALLLDDFPLHEGLEKTRMEIVRRLEELRGRGAQVVVTCAHRPSGMPLPERAAFAEVCYPDEPARLEIARRTAASRGLALPEEALRYLAARLTGSTRELQSAIARLAIEATLIGRGLQAADVVRVVGG